MIALMPATAKEDYSQEHIPEKGKGDIFIFRVSLSSTFLDVTDPW